MTTDLLATVLATQLILSSYRAPPDPCGLVSPTEIASALGTKPSPGTANGPSWDEESGAHVSVCSIGVGELFLSIAVAEFSTPAAASAAMKETEKVSQEVEEAIRISPQAGLGDSSLWGANADGAIWVAQKGKYMLNVTLTGHAGDGGRYRDPLKKLASSALTKM